MSPVIRRTMTMYGIKKIFLCGSERETGVRMNTLGINDVLNPLSHILVVFG